MQSHFLSFDRLEYQATVAAASMSEIVVIGPRKEFTVSVDGKAYLNWNDGSTTALTELVAADYTTLAFTAPDQIVRVGGSWVTDGYTAGRFITIKDAATAANNGTFEIESVTATALTTVEVTLETEGASTTENVSGYQELEVAATDTLLPTADTYSFRSTENSKQIRLYNPNAVTSLLVTVFVAHNI